MSKPRRCLTLVATAFVLLSAALALPSPAAAGFGDRTLREGMRGADVAALQRKLTRLGISTPVDRVFDRETKRSMRRYERRSDRRVNGVCSRADARHIQRALGSQPDAGADRDTGSGGSVAYGSRPIAFGDSGSDVEQLQRYLHRLGLPARVDGEYSPDTRRNVKDWEAWRYKRANGRVGTEEASAIRRQAQKGAQYVERENVFPIRGPHDYGGSGSRFGAPRGDRSHMGQDVSAAGGTKLVAVHSGRVAYREYQAGGAGYYLVIQGGDGSDSVYMHMRGRGVVKPGARVRAGEVIGKVGSTGASSGPHLHFELWTPNWFDGGEAYDPLPALKRWDRTT